LIELTLGAIAAALIAKAFDRAEDQVVDGGEGILRRLVETVRGRLSDAPEEGGATALTQVEEAFDSRTRVEKLARALDERADGDPEFGRELAALVQAAEDVGIDLKSTVQVSYGSQNLQFADISGGEFHISYGDGGGGSRPRRISD